MITYAHKTNGNESSGNMYKHATERADRGMNKAPGNITKETVSWK